MDIVSLLTITICIIAIYNFVFRDSEVDSVRSSVDGREYIVLDLPDKDVAADQLASLRIKLEDFITHMHGKGMKRPAVKRLKERFRAVISESKPDARYTSYTVNKGSKLYMCIRDDGKISDENTLFFVALHELAHVMTVSVGHTKEFWQNFRFLLKHAIKGRYYTYQPYHKRSQDYCGITINDTPYKMH